MKNIFTSSILTFSLALVFTACGDTKSKKTESVTEEAVASKTKMLDIEKPQLTFGFIKLTDMAPLAIAKEKGFFEEEGLFVSVEAQSNWKNVLDRVIDGQGHRARSGSPSCAPGR